MEPKYHWFCVYLWWFTPGCLPDTGEKGKAERRRSGNLTYIFIFKPLIRSIGLHHGKIPSLKLLAVLLRESEDQENTTDWERGFKKFMNLQDSPLHNKGSTISLYLLNLTISLWNSIFFSLSPAGCQILEVWNLCRVLKTISPNRPGGLEEISDFKGTWSIQLILSIKDK